MLRTVLDFIIENGIDGIFGFSSGAAVISACLQPEICQLAYDDDTLSTTTGPSSHVPMALRRGSVLSFTPSASRPVPRRGSSAPGAARRGSVWHGHPTAKQISTSGPRIDFVLCAHAVPARDICERLHIKPQHDTAAVRSVHIIGTSDPFKTESEEAALRFQGGTNRMILYHAAAHVLPRDLQTNEVLHHRLMSHVAGSISQVQLVYLYRSRVEYPS